MSFMQCRNGNGFTIIRDMKLGKTLWFLDICTHRVNFEQQKIARKRIWSVLKTFYGGSFISNKNHGDQGDSILSKMLDGNDCDDRNTSKARYTLK